MISDADVSDVSVLPLLPRKAIMTAWQLVPKQELAPVSASKDASAASRPASASNSESMVKVD